MSPATSSLSLLLSPSALNQTLTDNVIGDFEGGVDCAPLITRDGDCMAHSNGIEGERAELTAAVVSSMWDAQQGAANQVHVLLGELKLRHTVSQITRHPH